MPMYDRRLKARVFPWSHPHNSWLGYIYIFDDRDQVDMLIYFVPLEGEMRFRVHHCRATLTPSGPFGYTLDTEPSLDDDPVLGEIGIEPPQSQD